MQANRGGVTAIGGYMTQTTVTPTITAGAYDANDVVGGVMTVANALRVEGNTSRLRSIFITDKANQKAAGTILLFNADPSASTFTDNGAPTIAAADVGKIIRQIAVTAASYVTIDSKAFLEIDGGDKLLAAASGTSIYAVFLTTGTPTYAATTDLVFRFDFGHN